MNILLAMMAVLALLFGVAGFSARTHSERGIGAEQSASANTSPVQVAVDTAH